MKYLSFIYQPHVVGFCWGQSDYPSGKAQLWCWDVGYEAESRRAPVCHLTFLFQSLEKPNPFSPRMSAAETCKEEMQDVPWGKRLRFRRTQRQKKRCSISNYCRGIWVVGNWEVINALWQKLNKEFLHLLQCIMTQAALLPDLEYELLKSRFKTRSSVLISLYWTHQLIFQVKILPLKVTTFRTSPVNRKVE